MLLLLFLILRDSKPITGVLDCWSDNIRDLKTRAGSRKQFDILFCIFSELIDADYNHYLQPYTIPCYVISNGVITHFMLSWMFL